MPGRFEHEAHGIDRLPVERRRSERLAARPLDDAFDRRLIGSHRIEAAHQYIEQPILCGLFVEILARPFEDDPIDPPRESGEDRPLGNEVIAKFGKGNTRLAGDIGNRDLFPRPLGGKRHQRFDNTRTRVLGR